MDQKLCPKLILTEGKSEEIFASFLLSMCHIISSIVMLTCNRKGLANVWNDL